MTGNIRLFVLAGGLGLIALSSPAAHHRVFVLTGQSNSLGTTADPGEPDITTGVDPADTNTGFFWSNRDTSGDNTPAGVIGDSGGMITPIQAQQGQAANPLFWGPEVQFARSLYAAGARNVLIIKGSRGGGGNTWWYKNAANPQMYLHVTTIVAQALATLPPEDTFEIVGFLYLQGESDNTTEANQSGTRLATLISNLRQDLPNAANMHAVIGGIAAAGANRSTVRIQQAALAAGDPTIDYFSTLDLQGHLYDNLHFDKPGKLIVGDRYAQTFLASGVFAKMPVISEIMAVNSTTLLDENGETSDWIEILNPGWAPVELAGYRLTDHAGDPAKWAFPAGVSLTAGARRVVFCSGKDRTPAAGELHTNFVLPDHGGYLALHDPSGALLQSFSPALPQMFTDRSYGRPETTATNLVALGHPVRVAIPRDASLGTHWIHRTFDDSDPLVWADGTIGVGYESGLPPPLDSSAFDFQYEFDGTDSLVGPGDPLPENIDNYDPSGPDWFVGAGSPGSTATNGSIQHVSSASGNWWEANPVWTHAASGITSDSGYTLELEARIINGNGPAGKVMGVLGGPVGSTTSGTFLNLAEDEVIWRTTILPAGGGDNTDAMHVYRVVQRPGEASFLVWRDGVLIGRDLGGGHDNFPGRMILGDIGNAWTGAADVGSFRYTPGAFSPPGASAPPMDPLYAGLIGTDTTDFMFGARPGAYLRIAFELTVDPDELSSLTLDMRYDDGFVAWLNGVEIARRNSPPIPTWEDTSSTSRDDRFSVNPEHIDVSSALGQLVPGANLLAIHAMNHSVNAPRFLVLPELRATVTSSPYAYLSSPMPGEANTPGIPALEAWRTDYFSPAELLDDAVSGLDADPDFDGRSNAFEFSCVTDPRILTQGTPGTFTVEEHLVGEAGDPYLTIRFRLRIGVDNLEPVVEVSDDLGAWNTGPPPHAVPVGNPIYNGDGSETHTLRQATHTAPSGFMRLGLRFRDR